MKFSLTKWLLATALNLNYASAANTLRGLNQKPESIHRRVLEEEETGTYLVAEVEYSEEGPSIGKPEKIVNIELENGLIYQLINVHPSWNNGNRLSLKSGKSKIKIGKGASIVGDKINLHGGVPEEVKGLFGRNLVGNDDHRKLATTTGTRSVLAVRVIASDGQYGFSEDILSDEVFGTSGDPVNLVSQYKACSFNQLNFVPAVDSQITDGVVTITVTTSTSEGDGVMRNAVTSAINAQFGVSNPSQLANHIMYCLPPNTMSGIAYAYINSWNSVYSNQWCNYVSGQMHEIGHNLNFAHSNELGSYKDQTGMMGYSYSIDDGPKMCFNSAKSFQTGWYPTKVVTPTSADCGGFDGKIFGVSDYANTGGQGTTVVKVNVAGGGPDFFVNFNKMAGVNSETREAGNMVTIASADGEGTGYAESELLAKLSAGSSYSIQNFDGTGEDVTITFDSMDTSAARVVISYVGMVCGSLTTAPITPPPSKAPVTPSPTEMPVTPAPVTPAPSKAPVTPAPVTPAPSKAPITPAPITPHPTNVPTEKPSPCWEKYTPCDPNGVHFCCSGCQANGRWAGTCK